MPNHLETILAALLSALPTAVLRGNVDYISAHLDECKCNMKQNLKVSGICIVARLQACLSRARSHISITAVVLETSQRS